jgi:hypothetical protein
MKRKIVNVNYGIASSYSDGTIEINKKIKGKLRKKILEHERRHSLGVYDKDDFRNDFHSKNSHFFESLKFGIKNPEALINYFVVMYSYYFDKWTYNPTGVYPFLYFGIIFSLFFFLLFKVNFLLAFLGWICIFLVVNIILLIYTHYYTTKNK